MASESQCVSIPMLMMSAIGQQSQPLVGSKFPDALNCELVPLYKLPCNQWFVVFDSGTSKTVAYEHVITHMAIRDYPIDSLQMDNNGDLLVACSHMKVVGLTQTVWLPAKTLVLPIAIWGVTIAPMRKSNTEGS